MKVATVTSYHLPIGIFLLCSSSNFMGPRSLCGLSLAEMSLCNTGMYCYALFRVSLGFSIPSDNTHTGVYFSSADIHVLGKSFIYIIAFHTPALDLRLLGPLCTWEGSEYQVEQGVHACPAPESDSLNSFWLVAVVSISCTTHCCLRIVSIFRSRFLSEFSHKT